MEPNDVLTAIMTEFDSEFAKVSPEFKDLPHKPQIGARLYMIFDQSKEDLRLRYFKPGGHVLALKAAEQGLRRDQCVFEVLANSEDAMEQMRGDSLRPGEIMYKVTLGVAGQDKIAAA